MAAGQLGGAAGYGRLSTGNRAHNRPVVSPSVFAGAEESPDLRRHRANSVVEQRCALELLTSSDISPDGDFSPRKANGKDKY